MFARLQAAFMLLTSDVRVDTDELTQVCAGDLPGVDLTSNGKHDPAELTPIGAEIPTRTPYERLVDFGVPISRDFRAAGARARWDRKKRYDPKVYGYPIDKSRGASQGSRSWKAISTIVLHTAGTQGLHPDRWLGVPCHAAVANDATIVLCHELTTYLFAAHAANKYSVSLEIAGNQAITSAQLPAARALLTYMVEVLRDKRPGPVYIAPHRFSHKSRPKDCGAQIWQALGDWGMDELELELGPVVGSGRPLPF